jgi:hypothetical protein
MDAFANHYGFRTSATEDYGTVFSTSLCLARIKLAGTLR